MSNVTVKPQGVAALSCVGLSKVFPVMDAGEAWRILLGVPFNGKRVVAVDNVSLTVPKGKVIGIIGRNGAGKSTLLRILGGVYCPTSGYIIKGGEGISGIFELGGVGNRFMTGREYARRSLLLQGIAPSQIPALIEEIHDFSELGSVFDHRIFTYSTGMAARLYFSAAMAVQHHLYLIDEILSVGDEHFQGKCWQRIRQRLKEGASVVLVTHDWTAILKLCEEAHIMEQGKIIESGPSEKVVQSYLNLSCDPYFEGAKFCEDNPANYIAQSGQDAEIRFAVELTQSVPVVLSYSIELLNAGVNWEILILVQNLPLASTIGRHEVCLKIPRLPLTAGFYYLNLFLTSPHPAPGNVVPKISYDTRSWTCGNPVGLTVEGVSRRCSTVLPLTWQREGKV